MKNSKHTPGPWKVETYHGPLFKIQRDYDPAIGAEYRTEADRLLIQSAPEMLEALETICNEVTDLTFDQLCIVKDAIRKARGES